MIAVANALIPVFLIIALGVALKHTLLPSEEAWSATERLTYFVLFPALLIVTTATADLKDVPAGAVAIALFSSVIAMSAILLMAHPLLTRMFALSGPSYSSIFQGATRWNTYVGLAISGALYGTEGLALASVAIVSMVPILNVINVWVLAHYASDQKLGGRATLGHMLRNPLIWSCLIGIALNFSGFPLSKIVVAFGEILGRASLALGLLIVGAGLALGEAIRPNTRVLLTAGLKLLLMPLFAVGIGIALGISGPALMVVAITSSVPAAPTSYVLARQMGGDAPLLAQILTFETVVAFATIQIAITAAEMLAP